MGLDFIVRFSGGHLHFPGGAKYPARATMIGSTTVNGIPQGLSTGLYDFDPHTGEISPDRYSIEALRKFKSTPFAATQPVFM